MTLKSTSNPKGPRILHGDNQLGHILYLLLITMFLFSLSLFFIMGPFTNQEADGDANTSKLKC